jgi:hypothetical protein
MGRKTMIKRGLSCNICEREAETVECFECHNDTCRNCFALKSPGSSMPDLCLNCRKKSDERKAKFLQRKERRRAALDAQQAMNPINTRFDR